MKWLLPLLLLLRSCEWAPAAVRLDWDASAGATECRVHLGTNSRSYFTNLVVVEPDAFGGMLPPTSIVLSNLPAGTWYAAITAHNAAQACDWRETADKSDDPIEISFAVVTPMLDVTVWEADNIATPRAQWKPITTVRVPRSTGPPKFLMVSAVTVSTISNATLQVSRLAQTADSKRGKHR